MSKEEILRLIDLVTDPSVMTKAEAVEFLSEVRDDISSRIDALIDDMKGKGDWPPGGDLDKLPKLRTGAKHQRPQAGTAPTKVTTRFKTPKAKK